MPQPYLAIAARLIFVGTDELIATEKWVGRAAAALGAARSCRRWASALAG